MSFYLMLGVEMSGVSWCGDVSGLLALKGHYLYQVWRCQGSPGTNMTLFISGVEMSVVSWHYQDTINIGWGDVSRLLALSGHYQLPSGHVLYAISIGQPSFRRVINHSLIYKLDVLMQANDGHIRFRGRRALCFQRFQTPYGCVVNDKACVQGS